jgi:hypothetical protein
MRLWKAFIACPVIPGDVGCQHRTLKSEGITAAGVDEAKAIAEDTYIYG